MTTSFFDVTSMVSRWAIPAMILIIVVHARWRRLPMYESFITGAKEGFNVAVMIIPYLVAMLSVIAVFRASGAMEDIATGLAWLMRHVGLGRHTDKLELLPLAIIRPLSGSGARGVWLDLMAKHGPDSFLGYTATVMQGSTETTFYVLTVYFGSVNIKRLRHTVPACLIADVVGMFAAILLASLMYRA